MKQVNTGGLSFQDIRDRDKYYVDKSLLIKDMLEEDDGDVYLYTRPRRFGKTTNITMLDAFFNMEYKGNTWFDGLAISEFPEFDQYRNAFPVIYIDLKDVVPPDGEDYESFVVLMRRTIRETYDKFRYLLDSELVPYDDKNIFRSVLDGTIDGTSLGGSIRELCSMLMKHHGKKSIVLIDEYDRALTDTFGSDMQKRILGFYRNFLSSTLKSNPNLQMAYITGVMQVAKAGLFSGLNNITVNNVVSTTSDERFGFTDTEVNEILGYYGHPEKFDEVKEWYDGYRFGDAEVYNPYSVMKYVRNRFKPDGYWAESGKNTAFLWMLERVDKTNIDTVSSLVAGGSAVTALHFDITYEDMKYLKGAELFSMMVMTGNLKAVPEGREYRISIPNREVMIYLNRLLSINITSTDDTMRVEFCRSLLDGDSKKAESAINLILSGSSYFNLCHEYVYETIIMTMAGMILRSHTVRTEREEGNGRTDMILTPKTDGYPPIVIELKTTDRIDGLDAAVQDALHQIHDRRYYNGMNGKIILYGIAFCGVVAKVGTETLDL